MQYLTYEEYGSLGGELSLTAFNRNIDRACGIIDNATRCRVSLMDGVPQGVKALCRDLIEYLAKNTTSDAVVSSRSQSAGGVSESESFVIRSIEERAGEIDDMVKDYLLGLVDDNGTPLLYRGAMA